MFLRKLIILTSFIVFVTLELFAQKQKNETPDFYIGFSGGVNFTQPRVTSRYNMVTSVDGSDGLTKKYDPFFSNLGNQFHFWCWYNFLPELHFGISPGIGTYQYSYQSNMSWIESAGSDAVTIQTNYNQSLRYFEIPLTARYFYRMYKISPYIQGGAAYNILIGSNKSANTKITQSTIAGDISTEQGYNGETSSSYIRSKILVYGGVGVAVDLSPIIVTFDVNYHHSFNKINNETNRFQSDAFTGATYDTNDDIKLSHLVANVGIIFALHKKNVKGSVDCALFKVRTASASGNKKKKKK